MKMKKLLVSYIILTCALTAPAVAEEKKPGGPPPMLVAVEEVVAGKAEPMQELVGTVYFSRVSNVAAEVDGLVASVAVEDGDRVKAGGALLNLQIDFLETTYVKARSLYEQASVDLEQARKDLDRFDSLYSDKLIAETTYDAQLAKVQGLEKRVEGLGADVQRLYLEKEKMVIRAPFPGLVLKREVEKGEWVKVGSTVAVVADDREVDIVIDIPERLIGFLDKGREISVISGGNSYTGKYVALVPKGDIATRTFSIKIRMKNSGKLIEGMAARVMLPVSEGSSGLLVPRDAVINKFGRDVVYIVVDGLAKMVPVEINGYSGMQLGVKGPGLEAGQKVIIKGQERIFNDGTPVRFGS
jgi:RND family efflux transporter MFP subunit